MSSTISVSALARAQRQGAHETAADSPPWRIELLQSPRIVSLHTIRPPHVLQRKDAVIFAVLALDGPTTRTRIATLLWPTVQERDGKRNLRQRLFRLRKALGVELIFGVQTLQLSHHVVVPVLAAVQAFDHDPDACQGELLDALSFGELPEAQRWVAQARARWRQDRTDVLKMGARRALERKEFARALVFARRLVDDQPLDESAHRLLMSVLLERGEYDGAWVEFQRCQTMLATTGRQPDAETAALAARMAAHIKPADRLPRATVEMDAVRLVGRASAWSRCDLAWLDRTPVLISGESGVGKTRFIRDYAAAHAGVLLVAASAVDGREPFGLLRRLCSHAAAFGRREGAGGAPPADVQALISGQAVASAPLELDFGMQASYDLPAVPVPVPVPVPAAAKFNARPFSVVRLREGLARWLSQLATLGLAAIAIDDVHLADEASVSVLRAVAAEVAQLHWMLVSGDDATATQALAALAWAGADKQGRRCVVPLLPLNIAQMGELLLNLGLQEGPTGDVSAQLMARCGGNPAFLLETLDAMCRESAVKVFSSATELPAAQTLDALLRTRLGQLSPLELDVARVVTLACPDATAALLGAVLQLGFAELAAALRALAQAQVVVDLRIRPPLRELILRTMPAGTGRRLRRTLALQLARDGGEPARIAQLLDDDGEPAGAAAAWRAAAQRAHAFGLFHLEVAHLICAAERYRAAGLLQAAFATRLAWAEALLDSHGPAAAAQAIASLQAAAGSDDAQRLAATTLSARIALRLPDAAAASSHARSAVQLADRLSDASAQFDAMLLAVRALIAQGELEAALSQLGHCEQALLRLPSAVAAPRAQDLAAARAALFSRAARREDSVAAWRETGALALQRGDRRGVVNALLEQAREADRLARADEAVIVCREAERIIAEDIDLQPLGLACLAQLAAALAGCSRYKDALRCLEPIVPQSRRLGQPAAAHPGGAYPGEANPGEAHAAKLVLASLYLRLGQPQRARALLNATALAVAGETREIRVVQAQAMLLQARLERHAGRSSTPWFDRVRTHRMQAWDGAVQVIALAEGAAERRAQEALVDCQQALELAQTQHLPGLIDLARMRCAESWARAGELERAAEEAVLALTSARRHLTDFVYLPEVCLVAHTVLSQLGGNDLIEQSRTVLREAAAVIVALASHEVPDQFVDGFMLRNPVNREVLTRATRWLQPSEYTLRSRHPA